MNFLDDVNLYIVSFFKLSLTAVSRFLKNLLMENLVLCLKALIADWVVQAFTISEGPNKVILIIVDPSIVAFFIIFAIESD